MATLNITAAEIKPGDLYQGHRVLRVVVEESVHIGYHPLDEAHGALLEPTEPVTVEREEFDLVGAIMDVESGEASALQTLETLAYLVRSGIIVTLQGSWQRAAADAIGAGFIDHSGNITDYAIESLGDLEGED